MDWFAGVNAYLYTFPTDLKRIGFIPEDSDQFKVPEKQILKWKSHYSSIATVMGDKKMGTADGINSAGLVVNALYDTGADYIPIRKQSGTRLPDTKNNEHSPLQEDKKVLSVLNWAQFTLDKFECVKTAAQYYRKQKIQIVEENVPDGLGKSTPASLHLCLSDKTGNSAIIEVNNNEFVVYESEKFKVATNEPNYKTQLEINQYWQYTWGKGETPNPRPLFTVPGGVSSTQNFERASFYVSLSEPVNSLIKAVSQTRSMVAACAVPHGFNPRSASISSSTIWSNISDQASGTYYFLNMCNMAQVWLDFSTEITTCQRVQVMALEGEELIEKPPIFGNLNGKCTNTSDPYARAEKA
jgi:choloylglycine hydrolase